MEPLTDEQFDAICQQMDDILNPIGFKLVDGCRFTHRLVPTLDLDMSAIDPGCAISYALEYMVRQAKEEAKEELKSEFRRLIAWSDD